MTSKENKAAMGEVAESSPLDELLNKPFGYGSASSLPTPKRKKQKKPKPKLQRQWVNWPTASGYWWFKSKENPKVMPELCRATVCCSAMQVYTERNVSIGSRYRSEYGNESDYLFTPVTDRPSAEE